MKIKEVIHLVNNITWFQADWSLTILLSVHVRGQLFLNMIERYIRHLHVITADTCKQFMTEKFKKYTAHIGIIAKNYEVEKHYSLSMIDCYTQSLRRVYSIIMTEIPCIKPNLRVQMSLKVISNWATHNKLVFTLLFFCP